MCKLCMCRGVNHVQLDCTDLVPPVDGELERMRFCELTFAHQTTESSRRAVVGKPWSRAVDVRDEFQMTSPHCESLSTGKKSRPDSDADQVTVEYVRVVHTIGTAGQLNVDLTARDTNHIGCQVNKLSAFAV